MSRSLIPTGLAAGLAAAALIALAPVPAGGATKVGFPSNCGKPTFKPTSIVVACGDGNNRLKSIKWQSYGTDAASGTATAQVNDCTPNCASGKFKNYPAAVTLTKPKNCGKGVTQFTKPRETFTGSRPKGTNKTLTETFACS